MPLQVVSLDPFTFEPHRGNVGNAPLATTDDSDLLHYPTEIKSVLNNLETSGVVNIPDKDSSAVQNDLDLLMEWTNSITGPSNVEESETDSPDSGKSSPTVNSHSAIPNHGYQQDHRQVQTNFCQ